MHQDKTKRIGFVTAAEISELLDEKRKAARLTRTRAFELMVSYVTVDQLKTWQDLKRCEEEKVEPIGKVVSGIVKTIKEEAK